MLLWHIEGGLDAQVPICAAQVAELRDEVAAQARFATSKGDATARGQEIDVVDGHLVVEPLRGVDGVVLGIIKRLWVEAELAPQRAGVESHQRGDAVAIGGEAVPDDAYDGSLGGHVARVM